MVEQEPGHQELVEQLAEFVFYSFKFSRGQSPIQKSFYEYFFSIHPEIYEELAKTETTQLEREIFESSHDKVESYILGSKKGVRVKSPNHLSITPENIATELKKQIYTFFTDVSKERIKRGKLFRLVNEIAWFIIDRDLRYLNNPKADLPHAAKSFFVIYVLEAEPTPNPVFNQLFQQIRDQIKHYPEMIKRKIEDLKIKHYQATSRNRNQQQ